MARRVSKTTAEQLLAVWQERLRLQNWTIFLELPEPGDVGLTGETGDLPAIGYTDWDPDRLVATVKLDCALGKVEMEMTLIHELVHLVISGHTRDSGYDVNDERRVESLTEALYFGWSRRKRS